MIKLRIASNARDDLRDIRVYSKAAFGPRVARGYMVGLNRSFAMLRMHPLAGRSEEDLGDGVRGLAYRSHRIYYHAGEQEIVIVRILHHARDVVSVWSAKR